MSATRRYAVCYVILFIFPILYANKSPTLNDVLLALEKMVSFYKSSHRDMNLDGIYGLRVLEGQILVLLMEYEKGRHQHLPLSIVARLHMLHQRARNVSEWSLPYLAKQDKEYYNKLRPLVEKPFMVAHEYRRVDLTLRWKQTEQQQREGKVTFDEEFSDRCMGELMGTDQSTGRVCSVTPQCLEIMFVRGLLEYQITHQLIYTMLAEQEGCDGVLNQWLKEHGWPGGLSQVHLEFCSNNLIEIQDQMAPLEGYIIPIYQDLLMEQLFVCPALGYMEFLHNDWLKQILSWQKPLGCFGRMPVSDFGRNYKNRHHLDYQYEGDTKEDNKNNQVTETSEIDLQKRASAKNFKAKLSLTKDSENAVIQKSNKLHLVGAGGERNLTQTRQVASLDGGNGPSSRVKRGTLKKYGFLSQKINSMGSPGEKRKMHRREKTGAARPKRNNLSLMQREEMMNQRPGEGLVVGQEWELIKRKHTSMNNGQPNQVQKQGLLNYSEQETKRNIIRNRKKSIQEEQAPHITLQRKLLFERALPNNCLSHKTAVAAGALSQYLRFLVNPGSPSYQSLVSLDGRNIILNPSQPDSEDQEKSQDAGVYAYRSNTNQEQHAPLQAHQKEASLVKHMNQQVRDRRIERSQRRAVKDSLNQRQVDNIDNNNANIEHHVVLRPHPDDIIHSEVMDNQGDEDNPPQDYYDPDGDNDDLENYEAEIHRNDLPKLSLKVNPQFRHDFRIDNFDRRANQGDEEYEQYVDDDEEEDLQQNQRHVRPRVQKLDLLNPKRPGERHAPRRVVIDVPAGETAREANHDEDTYSYYDDDDGHNNNDRGGRRRDGSRMNLASSRLRHLKPRLVAAARPGLTSAAAMIAPGEKQLPHPGSSPPGKIYMVLFCVMLAMLVLMYRFVKKRRIVIRYHRNGCR